MATVQSERLRVIKETAEWQHRYLCSLQASNATFIERNAQTYKELLLEQGRRTELQKLFTTVCSHNEDLKAQIQFLRLEMASHSPKLHSPGVPHEYLPTTPRQEECVNVMPDPPGYRPRKRRLAPKVKGLKVVCN